jgi:hypothetical protein
MLMPPEVTESSGGKISVPKPITVEIGPCLTVNPAILLFCRTATDLTPQFRATARDMSLLRQCQLQNELATVIPSSSGGSEKMV